MSRTLPARYYVDPMRFCRELEHFFFRRWIAAGRADQIPSAGDYFLRDVAGESVIVVRESADSIRAYYNVCRHRGTRLCIEQQGDLLINGNASHFLGRRIQCHYHGWTYGLDGRLLGASQMDPETFRREDYPL